MLPYFDIFHLLLTYYYYFYQYELIWCVFEDFLSVKMLLHILDTEIFHHHEQN